MKFQTSANTEFGEKTDCSDRNFVLSSSNDIYLKLYKLGYEQLHLVSSFSQKMSLLVMSSE